MSKSKADDELTDLLTKLYNIQEDIGAKPKSTEEEKKAKAENISSMGTGKKAQEKGTKFLALKGQIIDRLKTIHEMMRSVQEKEAGGFGGDNAKEIIKLQADMREQMRLAGDDWKELEQIYNKEARKKRSKFTPEELEVQAELVQRLYGEIEKCKAAQMKGYARAGSGSDMDVGLKPMYMDSGSGARKGGGSWGGTGGGVALTGSQQQQLMEVEQRDADFDKQLDEIGEGIQDLQEIATMQGEEVKYQTEMLDQLHNKIDKTTEKLENVNHKLKETLDEVGRSSDKLCVDIMCIVLMIGFGAVMYNFMVAPKVA